MLEGGYHLTPNPAMTARYGRAVSHSVEMNFSKILFCQLFLVLIDGPYFIEHLKQTGILIII